MVGHVMIKGMGRGWRGWAGAGVDRLGRRLLRWGGGGQ